MGKKAVPVVEDGKLEGNLRVGSKKWIQELSFIESFRYIPKNDKPFTARKEKSKRGEESYWYGYRKVSGKLHKRYIGKSADLNVTRLDDIAKQLNECTVSNTDKKVIQKVTDAVYVTDDEVKRLQKTIEELQKTNQELHIKLQKKDEEIRCSLGKIKALEASRQEVSRAPKNKLPVATRKNKLVRPNCPNCNSQDLHNKGKRSSKQRWQCKSCGKNFSVDISNP